MRAVTRSLLVALVLLSGATRPLLLAQPVDPQSDPVRVTEYTLAATLDPLNRSITGQGRVVWRNTTLSPTSELYLLTPWNARRHVLTTWARERRLASAITADVLADASLGFTDLTSLALVTPDAREDLLNHITVEAPDDGNGDDATVWRIDLGRPVAPGHTIEIAFAWTARVPRLDDGIGARGHVLVAGRWFPQIAAFTADGWRPHQVHVRSASFTDFGRYQVDLRVPSGWLVGATGSETARQDHADGTTTHRYRADRVADFAWTTGPDFIERIERLSAEGMVPVEIRLLVRPDHVDYADRQLNAVRTALAAFTRWFGPYPWERMTIVDVPPTSSGTFMRAYPGLLPIETRWVSPWSGPDPEFDILKQVANQYWTAVVAPDTVVDGWLGEGLASFTAARAMTEAFSRRFVNVNRYFGDIVVWPNDDAPWSRLNDGARVASYRGTRHLLAATSSPTWRQNPAALDASLSSRVPLELLTLERLIGWDTLETILATYYTRGSFHHPSRAEFIGIANSISGRDLSWYFDAVQQAGASFDFGVGSVTSIDNGAGTVDNTVVVRRYGDGALPVEVRVIFDDGSSVVERWDARSASATMRFQRPTRVSTVEVDPDHVIALDVDRINNTWTSAPRARDAASTWAIRWALWFQHLLLTYAFFV